MTTAAADIHGPLEQHLYIENQYIHMHDTWFKEVDKGNWLHGMTYITVLIIDAETVMDELDNTYSKGYILVI